MRAFRVHYGNHLRLMLSAIVATSAICQPGFALEKPTGAPLVMSTIETEQALPLAILSPDHKTASCVTIRLHWNPKTDVGANDDATSFTLDLPATDPSAAIFTAQLWNASLASAMAWQEPWQGANWKVLQTPSSDGSGIDAALAVGMIATSARRPYPKETAVLASLNPDGSLGPVAKLSERMAAAAAAGVTKVIIAGVQRFDTTPSGEVINILRQASDLHLECIPVDNLIDATQTVMNDPLPEITLDSATPKYSNDVVSYIDDFSKKEQAELASGLKFAPKDADVAKYPPRQAALWKGIYADNESAQQAYRAGQVYVAYQLFLKANGRLHGLNALTGQNRVTFDVKTALNDAATLRQRLHDLMNPPSIDKGELQSAVLVAEMADWAYDVNAALEGAELVTKQTFSQRTDATMAEKDRAREAIVFAIEQARYLLSASSFYEGLLPHIGNNNPIKVDDNAAHLLPQLIPAQLAMARLFTDGIRQRASEIRDGLLFDPRLVAYVNVLRETKADWDARQRKKEAEAQMPTPTPAPKDGQTAEAAPVKLNDGNTTMVGFDPGTTYAPPHTALAPTAQSKKLSDVALCLIWANNDCEIATLDEKYLRLSGTVDPSTHEWHVKDRAKLDTLLQAADIGARQGLSFAAKAEVDPSVLAMIYEKAAHLRIQGDDSSALEALRQYWRCALLGNICWQLAHAHKAQAVDLSANPEGEDKPAADGEKKGEKTPDKAKEKTAAEQKPGDKPKTAPDVAPDKLVVAPPGDSIPTAPIATNTTTAPAPPPHPETTTNTANAQPTPLRAMPVTEEELTNTAAATPPAPTPAPAPVPPKAEPVTTPAPTPPPAAAAPDDSNIPVAPIAKPQDYTGGDTNAAPVIGPTPPKPPPAAKDANADGNASALP